MSGWLVLTGHGGHPAMTDPEEGEYKVALFDTEEIAQKWIDAHPKAKAAHAVELQRVCPECVGEGCQTCGFTGEANLKEEVVQRAIDALDRMRSDFPRNA